MSGEVEGSESGVIGEILTQTMLSHSAFWEMRAVHKLASTWETMLEAAACFSSFYLGHF
jgi:hypothetical protein